MSPRPTAEAAVRSSPAPLLLAALLAVVLVACTSSPTATLDDPRDPDPVDPPVAVEPAPRDEVPAAPGPPPGTEDSAVCDDGERATLVATVDGQLEAIADADWDRALDFASSGFRSGIDAARFRDLITEGFPVVADNRARDIGACRAVGDEATLLVTVEDQDGSQQLLLYLLEREADGWGIGGAAPAADGAPVPDEPTVTA